MLITAGIFTIADFISQLLKRDKILYNFRVLQNAMKFINV